MTKKHRANDDLLASDIKTEVRIGPDSLEQLPGLIAGAGSRVLLVHGHRPVEDGLLEKVRVLLNENDIPWANLGEILPNPKFSSVRRGVRVARKEKCDVILSLGGGSTLQCARGIAYGLKYKGKDLWDLWKGKGKCRGAVPVGALLTNPASGDELNDSCTLVRNGRQKTFRSPYGRCTFAVLDPKLSMLPRYPTMNQVFVLFADTFGKFAAADDPTSALPVLKRLCGCISSLSADIQDVDARTALFQAGLDAHELHEPSNSGLADLAGQVAFACSLPRGAAMSALFSAWYSSLAVTEAARLALLARDVFGIEEQEDGLAASAGLQAIQQMIVKMGLPLSLPESGLVLADSQLKKLARNLDQQQILEKANMEITDTGRKM